VKHTCHSATSTPETDSSVENEADENLEEEERENPTLEKNSESEPFRASILKFVMYVILVLVAIVVVLVITCAVVKTEPVEFWWEDKLAKRNYYY
jgi:t-SNARE complex subunit (syntaxin)